MYPGDYPGFEAIPSVVPTPPQLPMRLVVTGSLGLSTNHDITLQPQ